MRSLIQVELPANLCRLAAAPHRVQISIEGPVTQRSILDALESLYPMLQGTIRDHVSKVRRPFIRFFACEEDLSHLSLDEELPAAVAEGSEVFLIVGAIAGG